MNFDNPYHKTLLAPSDFTVRTTIEVAASRHAYIMGTHGKSGALQTTINILVEKLYEQLRLANIGPSFDRDAFECAVANATITLGSRGKRIATGLTSDGVQFAQSGQTADRNVRPGIAGVAQPAAVIQQSSDFGISSPSRKGNKKQKTS